uniref:Type-1 restriction enzyme EcoKI specificity protein n=1 Tax=Aliivibrio wodanis TaxID=80852 RepID=A0A5Q4ZUS8_9GAMM|nr:Type-1 restriction enzyme EcoKI specificity protein [Aliivibrio wodanis]
MRKLPEGWVHQDLVDITTKIGSGSTPRGGQEAYKTEGIPLVRSMNVRFSGIATKGLAFIDDEQAAKLSAVTINDRDVLLNITGASIGRVSVARDWAIGGRVNQHVCIIRPVFPDPLSDYLNYYLMTPVMQDYINSNESGATRQALTKAKVESLSIPLAPLAEQKRIVEKLDEVLAQVDTIKARLDGIPSLLKRFRQSVLASAVSGKLTSSDNKRGQLSKLGDTGVEIKTGPFGSALHKSDYVEGGISVINPMHINDGKITPATQMSITTEKFESLVAWHLRDGDVVVGRRGEMGRAAVVNEASSKPCLCGTGSMLLRCNDDINPEYLSYIIRSPIAVSYFNATSVGSTMVNLNQKVIKNLEVYFPLLEEQKEIVRLVDQYFAFADTIEAQVKKAQARVDNLTQSILAKAFRGELVPQDPNDEPADKLLERIAQVRIEAEALAKATKKAETARKKAEKAAAKG